MNLQFERKIETNKWLIKARWLYILGVFLIGVLTKVISNSNIYFSVTTMVQLVITIVVCNLLYWLAIKWIENNGSERALLYLSYIQLAIEVVLFTIITHLAGGVESISMVFFFLPIVAASLIVGTAGAIIVALVSGTLVNALILFEYWGFIPHIYRYGVNTLEYVDISVGLTKSVTVSIFYIIIAWFSGYGSSILFQREKLVEEKTEQMDRQTKMLVRRDIKLSDINSKLLEEKNKVGAMIANFTDPILFLDGSGRLKLFNASARINLGLGNDDLDYKVSPERHFSLDNFKELIKMEYTVKIAEESVGEFPLEEMTINSKPDEKIYKVITASVYNDEHTIAYGYIKIFYDLTREKMIDRLKSEFISIAAHQLRTPLTSIKWVIKMALDGDAGPLNEEQKDLLNKGFISNERVIRLVNDLLNVSRIEEGRFGYVFNKYDFQEVLNTVIESSESTIAKNHINLVVNKPEPMPQVYMDKNKIALVVQNLVDNAMKYSPEYSKIEIVIESDGKFLKVAVKDSGVGIPKEDQQRLFSKFFRASNVLRLQTEGTGLGLFIVKNIIDKHGGSLSVESEEGRGTKMSFTIPL